MIHDEKEKVEKPKRNRFGIFLAALFLASISLGAAFKFTGLLLNIDLTASSGGTLTITNASSQIQVITGSSAHTVQLPNATTLAKGYWYLVINESSTTVSINNSSSFTIGRLGPRMSAMMVVTSTGTSGGPYTYSEMATPQNTKGDLAVHDGSVLRRLPIAQADGMVPVSMSSEGLGIKWVTTTQWSSGASSGSMYLLIFGGAGTWPGSPANCTADPCTIYHESGPTADWISSVARVSSSVYNVNIQSGIFSGADYVCAGLATDWGGVNTAWVGMQAASPSGTQMPIECRDAGGGTDCIAMIMCRD